MLSWESLEEEALAGSVSYGRLCKFGQYLENLDISPREYVDIALSNEKIETTALLKSLASRGYSGGRTALGAHRRRDCVCYKESK